jgi:hypothetical protein
VDEWILLYVMRTEVVLLELCHLQGKNIIICCQQGIIPMSYVVEITILPVNCSDPRIRALMPNSNIPTSPVFQCEDGQVYFRKHSTIIKVIIKMSSITEKTSSWKNLLCLHMFLTVW